MRVITEFHSHQGPFIGRLFSQELLCLFYRRNHRAKEE